MRIVQINATCGMGSTGKICVAVSELLTQAGVENYILYSSGHSDYPLGRKYMSEWEVKLQALKAKLFGNYGFQSKRATKRLIAELERIAPDIVHLHNLHAHNVHLAHLFTYLKANRIKIYWTFHDCWAFTGYCPYYDMAGCDQWKKDGCRACVQKHRFSWFFDRSSFLYSKKKTLFSRLDMTIITPSQWMTEQVKQSFLGDYETKVINNGIDLSVFKPVESDFRTRYRIEDKHIVLGVAFSWEARKGVDVFIELSRRLDTGFQIVLIGTDDETDKILPDSIISIHRTQSQRELAEIYASADVFVNPTREENFPTTNLEALACGIPVITFQTGGSPEAIDECCGCVVEKNDVAALVEKVILLCRGTKHSMEDCIAKASQYDMREKFSEYIRMYEAN